MGGLLNNLCGIKGDVHEGDLFSSTDEGACFQEMAFVAIPNALLLLVLAPTFLRPSTLLSKTPHPDHDKTELLYSKIGVLTSLFVLPVVTIILQGEDKLPYPLAWLDASSKNGQLPPAAFLVELSSAAAWALSVVHVFLSAKHSQPQHPALFLWWILACGGNTARLAIPLRTAIVHHHAVPGSIAVLGGASLLSFTAAALGSLSLMKWLRGVSRASTEESLETPLLGAAAAEAEGEAKPGFGTLKAPLESASLISRLLFLWLSPILSVGYKRPLKEADLYALPTQDKGEEVIKRFQKEWAKEMDPDPKLNPKPDPKLYRALMRAFGRPFLFAALFKLGYDCLQFVGPQVLHAVITYLGSGAAEPWVAWVPSNLQGYYLVGVLLTASILQTLLLHQYFFIVFRVGMNLRTSTVQAVYRKSLRLSSNARQGTDTGTIVNLMSTDATRLQDLTTYLATLWSGPTQVALALFFLYRLMGPSTFAGVAVMLVSIPLNGWTARKMKLISREVMKVKDERIKRTNETINAIKLIKCSAWEYLMFDHIDEARSDELRKLRGFIMLRACIMIFFTAVPLVVSSATFLCYILMGHELDAKTAFTALSLFNIMRFPLAMFPNTINNVVEATVSTKRIETFLREREMDRSATRASLSPALEGGAAVEIKGDAAFTWAPPAAAGEPQPAAVLKDLNLKVKKGELLAVVGSVGSGKTSLLSAVLGEMTTLEGQVSVRGEVAFAAQTAFIINGTVRENILFGREYDEEWYNKCIWACCLAPDLELLPAGDLEEIGENGINLSGGQRQRVSLARAVYRNADVYLLDDVLSAVDAHVGADMFQRCVLEVLKPKAVILVTHGMQYIASSENVLSLVDGRVAEYGAYKTLTKEGSSSNLVQLLQRYEEDLNKLQEDSETQEPASPKAAPAVIPKPVAPAVAAGTAPSAKVVLPADGVLIKKEVKQEGALRAGSYHAYMMAYGGVLPVGFIICLYGVYSTAQVVSNWWLSYWSDNSGAHTQYWFLALYTGLSFVAIFIMLGRNILSAYLSTKAAGIMHQRLLKSVLRAPLSFFHTTPTGRILNRFSQDTYTVDEKVTDTLTTYLNQILAVASTVVVVGVAVPWFMVLVPLIGAFYMYIEKYYVPSSREMKRLDSISRSPIYSHFSETLQGVSTIRAFREVDRFQEENQIRIDRNLSAYFIYITSNRWLAVRLESTGTAISVSTTLLAVVTRGTLASSLAGLAITYALNITQGLNWLVRTASEKEANVVSLERVLEYSELTPEPPTSIPSKTPPPEWPQAGAIELRNLTLCYRHGLPPVLNRVSCRINPKEKVGICGRTGAGKSSLMVALLRMADVIEGELLIDGINVCEIGLHDLRSKLAIIPQEATLFAGTLTSNLDPLGMHTAQQMWDALRHVQLDTTVQDMGGLDSLVTEDGSNWSHGQRQLICMARALLRGCRIILLDEATASCDVETDAVLQSTIRTVFKDCTTLTVAHRIHTISDSDKIMVLSNGDIAEFESPATLMNKPGSLYRELVEENALDEADEARAGPHGFGWDGEAEVAMHITVEDGWTVLRGKVYALSPYLDFHPGGMAILKCMLGKDSTALYDKYHKWAYMLQVCQVGMLDTYVPGSDSEEDEERDDFSFRT
ncbi:hypothetical protein CYMTET_15230 [Cymbomonas tetramitiformis]|uniref:Uncharacterized protein n=1 Tax=Cymbomonas tetramitiformis TaxID=36881 RepID=A0AAE0L9I8_9CHLO|nr:hypothetical protein CYMTET_15230 [Cymbomonas tetramitiformis]